VFLSIVIPAQAGIQTSLNGCGLATEFIRAILDPEFELFHADEDALASDEQQQSSRGTLTRFRPAPG
jgi:hypothetical protein